MEDCDLRVIVTTDKLDRRGLAELSARFGSTVTLVDPNDDTGGVTAVAWGAAASSPSAFAGMICSYATAWWTADLGFRLLNEQRRIFGARAPLVYLIQDFEPGFYPWSDKYALADATYRRPDDTVGVDQFRRTGRPYGRCARFSAAWCLPYEIDPFGARLKPTVKEKIILAIAARGGLRTAFHFNRRRSAPLAGSRPRPELCMAHRLCGRRIRPRPDSRTGKRHVSGQDVIGRLRRSPEPDRHRPVAHDRPAPQHAPLEMASAGAVTITNNYESKNMSARADAILSLDLISPDSIADALDAARAQVHLDRPTAPITVRPLASPYPAMDLAAVVAHLLGRRWTAPQEGGQGGQARAIVA